MCTGSMAGMRAVDAVLVGWQMSGNVRNLARAYAMQGIVAYNPCTYVIEHRS